MTELTTKVNFEIYLSFIEIYKNISICLRYKLFLLSIIISYKTHTNL